MPLRRYIEKCVVLLMNVKDADNPSFYKKAIIASHDASKWLVTNFL